MLRRLALIAGLVSAFNITTAYAQTWKPEKPVEMVVGVAAGGSVDIHARLVQKLWQGVVPVPVTVVNRPSAGSAVAWAYLNQHAGDGHFISLTSNSIVINSILGQNPLNFTDVTPICQLVNEFIALSVKADSPYKTVQDIVAALRKDPESVRFGLATSLGNPNHIAIALMARSAGVDPKKLRVVVFNASPQAMTAVLGGHLDVVASNASGPQVHVQAGTMRTIVVAAPKRLGGALATIPTFRESKMDIVSGFWRGAIGPKGLRPEQVAYWEEQFAKAAQSPEWKAEMDKGQLEQTFMRAAESRKFLEAESKEYRAILTELGLAKPAQ